MPLKKYLAMFLKLGIYFFAVIGFILVAGFFAVKFHLTDIKGIIDLNDRQFQQANKNVNTSIFNTNLINTQNQQDITKINCKISKIVKNYPINAQLIADNYNRTKSIVLAQNMLEAFKIRAANDQKIQNDLIGCDFGANNFIQPEFISPIKNIFPWVNSAEWLVFKDAIIKDAQQINLVAKDTGTNPRLIVAQVFAEQIRLYNSDREIFKQVFQPLKILGNETQFSLGVAGIKEETAKKIEANLKDQNSPYYLGKKYENILDFKTNEQNTERIKRLTQEHDRYYSYLYTALFIKEIEAQWQKSGFDISNRPEIIGTLFNIGFNHSIPNQNPQVGGAKIELNSQIYSFGSLGYEFYYSGELSEYFPY